MAQQVWKAESSIVDMAMNLIGQYHPDLALVSDEIAIIFREKAGKAGGEVVLGKSRKASPLFGVLGETDYKFIIELAGDEWEGLTSKQKLALLDHHLCACRTEEDPKTGDLKCFIAPPDVAMYFDEMDRYGDWRPRPDDDETGPVSPVEEMFGKKDDEDDAGGED
ncbi:putative metallopeptidase [Deltaproteobacteria bacterium]|nr:putative metallopeptidase [Deltaproteobacteria bacterium]